MKKKVCPIVLGIIVLYWFLSMMIYRFRHPDMTETQLLLHLWDALRLCK